MNVQIRLFAGLHDLLGRRNVTLELKDGATVSDLREQLAKEYPVVAPYLATLVCAVEEEYVPSEHRLNEGDEVALIPPVSGGNGAVTGPFLVTADPLDPAPLIAAVRADASGALALFFGVARNHSNGRRVTALEYDAYPSMAERKLNEVAEEVAGRWPITGIGAFHRTGRLGIGETSLLVAVSAPHRAEAFEACHHAVDRIKQVVPIWKKEIWETGEGEWVAGHAVDVAKPAVRTA